MRQADVEADGFGSNVKRAAIGRLHRFLVRRRSRQPSAAHWRVCSLRSPGDRIRGPLRSSGLFSRTRSAISKQRANFLLPVSSASAAFNSCTLCCAPAGSQIRVLPKTTIV